MSAKALADSVLFQVQDTGQGIPSNNVETIFGRFQQVDASDSRQKGGTGLGLAICRSIVQQHGGRIWPQSVLGKGSIFYFTCQTVEALHRFISIEVGKTTQSVKKKPNTKASNVTIKQTSTRSVSTESLRCLGRQA